MNFFTVLAVIAAAIILYCLYLLRESRMLKTFRRAIISSTTEESKEEALSKIRSILLTLKGMPGDNLINYDVTGDDSFLIGLLDCSTAEEILEKIDSVI